MPRSGAPGALSPIVFEALCGPSGKVIATTLRAIPWSERFPSGELWTPDSRAKPLRPEALLGCCLQRRGPAPLSGARRAGPVGRRPSCMKKATGKQGPPRACASHEAEQSAALARRFHPGWGYGSFHSRLGYGGFHPGWGFVRIAGRRGHRVPEGGAGGTGRIAS